MSNERQERNPTHLVEVIIHPSSNSKPFIFLDRDGDGRLVLTPVSLVDQPQLKLLNRCHVLAEDRVLRALHREREDVVVIRLHHVVLDRESLLDHHDRKRVLLVSADRANVVFAVSCVDTACCVNKLRYGSRRLDTSDRCGLVDTEVLCPLCVRLDCDLSVRLQTLFQSVLLAVGETTIHDAGHRDTE